MENSICNNYFGVAVCCVYRSNYSANDMQAALIRALILNCGPCYLLYTRAIAILRICNIVPYKPIHLLLKLSIIMAGSCLKTGQHSIFVFIKIIKNNTRILNTLFIPILPTVVKYVKLFG